MEKIGAANESDVSLRSVIRTGDLKRRPSRPPQNDALPVLAQLLADSPRTVFKNLIESAAKLCQGGSAGICLLAEHDGRRVFRCHEASGQWAWLTDNIIPIESSPCGVVLKRKSTQLFWRPHRHFRDMAAFEPLAIESLHAPFRVRGEVIGTAWVVGHDQGACFDAEDARILETLANFASMAHQISSSLDALEKQDLALRESERRFRLLADSSPLIVWVVDPEGNQQFINEAYRAFFGVTDEQVLNHDWEALVHPDDLAEHNASFLAALRARKPWSFQLRVRRADGQWRWIESRAKPCFSDAGEFLGFVGSSPDITEQKLHREHLEKLVAERTRELKCSHRILAERTATAEEQAGKLQQMSHELVQAEQRERARLARRLHDHLQQLLVGARLHLDRIDRRGLEEISEQAVASVRELLDESLDDTRLLAVELQPAGLRLRRWCEVLDWLGAWMRDKHGLNVTIRADSVAEPAGEQVRALLFECVRELLFNIVKHAGVNEARVTSRRGKAGQIRIVVQDKGCGFDPGKTTGALISGPTGLGLETFKERLELIGGQLNMASYPGQGTRITLLAPCAG